MTTVNASGVRPSDELEARLERSEQRVRALEHFLVELLTSFDPGGLGRGVTVREAAQAAVRLVNMSFPDELDSRLQILTALAMTFVSSNDYVETMRCLDQLEVALQQTGQDRDGPAWNRWHIMRAWALSCLGRSAEARPAIEALVDRLARCHPVDRSTLGEARRVLADIHFSLGDPGSSLPLIRQSIEDIQSAVPINESLLQWTRSDLAAVLQCMGGVVEAERIHLEVLAWQDAHLLARHPNRLHTLTNLGCLLLDQGRFDEAHRYLSLLYAGRSEAYGPASMTALGAANLLSVALLGMGRVGEAEVMCDEAIAVRERQPDPKPFQLVEPLIRQSEIRLALGRTADAATSLAQVRKLLTAGGGDATSAWLGALADGVEARMHAVAGHRDQAVAAASAASLVMARTLGDGDGRARRMRVLLAVLLAGWETASPEASRAWLDHQAPMMRHMVDQGRREAERFPGLARAVVPR
jgi:tetratricopeptide (TPR) repeat protein